METTRFAWLLAGLLALSGAALAQSSSLDAGAPLTAGGPALPAAASARLVLGGPPQPAAAPQPTTLSDLARLQLLPQPVAGQPAHGLQPTELARVFPQCVHPLASFRPDIAALATAVAGSSPGLVALSWPLGSAGVPAGGATPGQHLKLLTTAGEQLVVVARPAAAGSHALVVSAAGGLAGRSVFVLGLEHPAAQALDYEALAQLGLSTTQQLAQQLAAVQQQLADLRSQLTAVQHLNGELLLDHAKQEDLRQQLNLLQSQQAAAFSGGAPAPVAGLAGRVSSSFTITL